MTSTTQRTTTQLTPANTVDLGTGDQRDFDVVAVDVVSDPHVKTNGLEQVQFELQLSLADPYES